MNIESDSQLEKEKNYFKYIGEDDWKELSKDADYGWYLKKIDNTFLLNLRQNKIEISNFLNCDFKMLYNDNCSSINILNIYWKVNGQNRYFKKINDNEWLEYVNFCKQDSLKFVSCNTDSLALKKADGSVLNINSYQALYLNQQASFQHLYFGHWVIVALKTDNQGQVEILITLKENKTPEFLLNQVKQVEKKVEPKQIENYVPPVEVKIEKKIETVKLEPKIETVQTKEQVEVKPKAIAKYAWKVKDQEMYFKLINEDKWAQIENGKHKNILTKINESDSPEYDLMLKSIDGSVLKFNSDRVFVKKLFNDEFKQLYLGEWTCVANLNEVWKINEQDSYFRRFDPKVWKEFKNEEEVDTLKFLSCNGDCLELEKQDGSIVRLNQNEALISQNGSGFTHLFDGKWISLINEDKLIVQEPKKPKSKGFFGRLFGCFRS